MQHFYQVKEKKLSKYKNILGIVLARGSSKGIKNKNLLKLNGKTLIEISLENALKSKRLNKIIFSSDSQKLIKIAKKKIKVKFKRPKSLALDSSSSYDVAKHAVKWLIKNEKWKADIVVILSPTTPFRKPKHIDKTIEMLINSKSNTAMTITDPSYPPYWMFKKRNNKFNFILPKGKKIYRRQDCPRVYQPAGMVYAIKSKYLFKLNTILPEKNTLCLYVNKNEAINIDNIIDYKLAKIIAKKI